MRIAILDDYQGVARSLADWDRLGADVRVFGTPFADETDVVTALADFDVLVAMRERTAFPSSTLGALPRLKLLVTTGPVNAAIDVPAARDLGITVCGTGYFPHPTVELTWGLILSAARLIPQQVDAVRRGGWQEGLGTSLRGATLGLLGLGRLGTAVAEIGRAFGMRTIAWSQHLTPADAEARGAIHVSRDELFRRSDVLSVHVVLSGRTRGLVGARELGLMKPTAVLVNTSRGPVVEEEALITALTEKRIASAALDVFDREPLPAGHPLRSLPNAVVTPHIGYVSRDLYEVFYRDAVEDIAAWQAGTPVRVLS
ncbi:D-2-hydroxyacid dehydrogenase family protein [Streptomyces humi]|uniref:D-2-hydroxyacid dehydrogenase family protein n=1 Tax=Streptomyces humi TaxID=1428620 RepID=UPI0006289AD3|nr:D-2-hydroxyacid dehydrogenase family protein [Streptomyces humi]